MKKNMSVVIAVIFIIGIIIVSIIMENNSKAQPEKVVLMDGLHKVAFKFKDYGTVTFELNGDEAPVTVSNFIRLVKKGFYNGLTLHRVQKDFVIQGGDPEGNGQGGAGSSQFFIVMKDSTYLDGQYAGFGHVIEGMEILDKINEEKSKYAINERGLLPKVDQVIIEKAVVID